MIQRAARFPLETGFVPYPPKNSSRDCSKGDLGAVIEPLQCHGPYGFLFSRLRAYKNSSCYSILVTPRIGYGYAGTEMSTLHLCSELTAWLFAANLDTRNFLFRSSS